MVCPYDGEALAWGSHGDSTAAGRPRRGANVLGAVPSPSGGRWEPPLRTLRLIRSRAAVPGDACPCAPRFRCRRRGSRALPAAGRGAVLRRGSPARQLRGPPLGGGLWGRVRPPICAAGGRGQLLPGPGPRRRHRGMARAKRGGADAARCRCRSTGCDADRLGAAWAQSAAAATRQDGRCLAHCRPAGGQSQAGAALGAAAFRSRRRPAPAGEAATWAAAPRRGGGRCGCGRWRRCRPQDSSVCGSCCLRPRPPPGADGPA